MAEETEETSMKISEERAVDSCHRLSPDSPGGCSETCLPQRRKYRLLKRQKEECQITFVGKMLGKGGFGTVSQVYDKTKGLALVLKTIRVNPLRIEVNGEERFRYTSQDFPFCEINVLARLQSCYSPYLMDLITSSQCSDLPLDNENVGIIMPLASNSLDDLIKDPNVVLTSGQLLSLLHSMALSVFTMHRALFLHRDIKPPNFLCTDDQNSVFISDFGLSCRMLHPKETVNVKGVAGTEDYLSPAALDGKYSEASDIFALGVSMAELTSKPSTLKPLPNFNDLLTGKAVVTGIDFPALTPQEQQLIYLRAGLERFLSDTAAAEAIAKHIAKFEQSSGQDDLVNFLSLPIFRGLRKYPARIEKPRIDQRPKGRSSWDPHHIWNLMSSAAPYEAKWIAHLLVFDLAQRVNSSGRGLNFSKVAKYAPFESFEVALFAVEAVANTCIHLGLDYIASRSMATATTPPAGIKSPTNLMERFACMARSENYLLEDLSLLSYVESNHDAVIMHYLVMSPRYLEAKRFLRRALYDLRQIMVVDQKFEKVEAPDQILQFDLAMTYRDFGIDHPEIFDQIEAYMDSVARKEVV